MELYVCGIVSSRSALGVAHTDEVQCELDKPTVPWLVTPLL